MRFAKLALAVPVLLGLSAALERPAAAQVNISANITGTAPSASANQDVTNALNFLATDFAPNTGSATFHMTASIQWVDLGFSSSGYTLGDSSAGSSSFQTHNNTLYINPLDRYLFGAASTVNTGGSYADFTIQLNSNSQVPWDYTLAKPSNFSNISLASVLYHESIHSMGFAAFNNSDGSYDFSTNSNVSAPTLWTTHLFDATTNQAFTADTLAQRQAVMVSGDNSQLLFTGTDAQAANGGNRVSMYAPTSFQVGSSDGSHIAFNQSGAGLLYPAISNSVYLTPTKLELAMMQDIGWRTINSPAVPEASSLISLGALLGLGGLFVLTRKRQTKV